MLTRPTSGKGAGGLSRILPALFLVVWALLMAGTAALAGRLVWEQTVWSWQRGPQMVGFSLMHAGPAFLILFPPLLMLWLLVALVLIIRRLLRRERLSVSSWAPFLLSIAVLGVLALPYGFWQRLFVDRLAHGRYAGEFVTYAAADGDLATVKAFVSHGVSADVRNLSGQSGLHAAAVQGQVPVLEYLLSKGADIDGIDRSGDSPLEIAISEKRDKAAELLSKRGAKRIRGDEATRQKAAEDYVRETSAEMDKAMGREPR